MAVACLANIAIFAGGMAALYGLDWYKNRRRQNRKLTKKLIVESITIAAFSSRNREISR
jgi:hypothetical protein